MDKVARVYRGAVHFPANSSTYVEHLITSSRHVLYITVRESEFAKTIRQRSYVNISIICGVRGASWIRGEVAKNKTI